MLLRMTRRRWSDLVWPAQSTHRRQARAWRRRQSLGTMGLALLVRGLAERSTHARCFHRSRSSPRPGCSGLAAPDPVLGLVLTTAALQGPSTHSTLLLVALSRGTVTGADPLWTYTEEGAAAFYPLAVVPLARGAERPQGQREITGARRQADPCVH